ncbi:MAG TPA: biopolymer transporter ExbD [Gemmatimonadaceae bacterium]|nr:biopolymer transporter ExbD [Gemmatimonadaceae bacterium]
MGMSAGGGTGIKAEPNVTPMIDVMLVLLIIFMLIIPQISAGFTAQPPEGANLKPHPEEDTDQVLGIDRNGVYYLNRDPIKPEDLGPTLSRIFTAPGRSEFILYLKADRNLDYSKVLEALDVAAKNGVHVTGLITEQQKGTESIVEQPTGGQ